ncbi:breast cancer anti-estrogen resistance protein 3-like isoform X2 [Anneissia japonica]|uniref:breast cancer anti-estrogen resistance protein 3-like isoform X2 n=1 Tax=Anneissia japonica TaxID=1529436 RepID=UPI00142564C3|nr:breast cancer anti-estrogen resistance protein 3-like isoform X2 [Anneissia japonica]
MIDSMERRDFNDQKNTQVDKESKKVRKRWSLIPNKLGRSKSFRKEGSKNGSAKVEYDVALRRGASEHRGRTKNKQKQIISISSPTVELSTIDITDENSIYSSVNRKPDVQLAALELFNDMMTQGVAVDVWLRTLELEEYVSLFKPNTTVDSLLHLTEKDLLDLGVKSPVHRARIASNLVLIRQKCARYNTAGHIGTLPRKKSQAAHINKTNRYSIQEESSKFYRPTPSKMDSRQNEPTPDQLKKDLEMELNLPHDDIRSHAWFHGGISREIAVKSLKQDGEFLVRDSISKQGSYVLGVMWHNEVLHYVINKTIQQEYTPYAKIQYQLENNVFDSVPALIMFYHGKKPISRTSNAIIRMPVNRTLPLSYTDSKYAETNLKQTDAPVYGPLPTKVITPRMSDLPERFQLHKQLSKDESETYYDTPIGSRSKIIDPPNQDLYSYPNKTRTCEIMSPKEMDANNSDIKTDQNFSYLHEKPVRDDGITDHSNIEKLKDDSSQLVYESFSRNRFLSETGEPDSEAQEPLTVHPTGIVQHPRLPTNQMCSQFHPSDFKCNILPENHRILDIQVLSKVQDFLINVNPSILAQHILSLDVELLQMLSIPDGCLSGLELLTLPQGCYLRNDLQERMNCLRLWCAVTIVYCMEIEKRVNLLHAWIQVAEATIFKMGDLFAFEAIMEGLASKQVRDLRLTWELLRKSYTSSALLHDTKLRSHFKEHQQGKTVLTLSQTSIPAIMPIVQLLEMDWTSLTSRDWHQPINKEVTDNLPKDGLWVDSTDSFGLEVFKRHLSLVRNIISKTTTYQLNANSKLQSFMPEKDILDSFRTELHMVILWGQKGLHSNGKDRVMKYEQMLNLLATKAEPSI